jgi:hypothetical protein
MKQFYHTKTLTWKALMLSKIQITGAASYFAQEVNVLHPEVGRVILGRSLRTIL